MYMEVVCEKCAIAMLEFPSIRESIDVQSGFCGILDVAKVFWVVA